MACQVPSVCVDYFPGVRSYPKSPQHWGSLWAGSSSLNPNFLTASKLTDGASKRGMSCLAETNLG